MSTSQPIVYDTTGASQSNLMQLAQMVSQNMQNGTAYSITGPNASYVQNYATGLSGVKVIPGQTSAGNETPATGTDWLSMLGQGASSTLAGGSAGVAAAGAGNSASANAAAGGAASAGSNLGATSNLSLTGWIQSHAANYGLVIMGALLVLGALLISQRNNIETVAKIAAV